MADPDPAAPTDAATAAVDMTIAADQPPPHMEPAIEAVHPEKDTPAPVTVIESVEGTDTSAAAQTASAPDTAPVAAAPSPAPSSSSPYALPKFVLTPVEVSADESPDTAPKPGHQHATSQTLITSAPALRTRPDSETTIVVEDPALAESVTVIRRYQRVLRRLFDHYAVESGAGAVLDAGAFLTLCKEFAVVPALLEPDELSAVYRAVQRPALSFRDLIAVLTRLALTVYRQSTRLLGAEQKLSALFRAMQLDQKDIVLHRLRKMPPATATATAVDLDFDQKDLDREVDRILDSMQAPAPDAAAATDLIGPLAAEVQATMDRVRQYTATDAAGRRPGRGGPSTDPARLGWRPGAVAADADPFLRPIVPPGPITTLPPLYYPGLSSTMWRAAAAPAPFSSSESPSTSRSHDTNDDDGGGGVRAPKKATAPAPLPSEKRRRPEPAPKAPKPSSAGAVVAAKAKGRAVGEATRAKAAHVAAAEKVTERDMQRRHLGQLDRRQGRQIQRLGRHVPAQFAGKYSAAVS